MHLKLLGIKKEKTNKITVNIQLTAKLSTSRTPKKYTNVHSRVAINAVTTTKRNQWVEAM